jgi:spore maturation protein CgeB
MKILCVFGAHQYGNPLRGESTESFSFIPALKALGHEVVLFDSWNKTAFKNYAELNTALVQACIKERPSVIFWVAMTVEIWLETLDYIRESFGIRVVHWAPDDSWKFKQHSRFIASHVDLCVTTYPEYLSKYKKIDATAVESGWGVPETWGGPCVSAANCKYDVTFVGSAQPARKAMIVALEALGIKVQCFGYGWPQGPLAANDIPTIYRNSQISLNFSDSTGDNQIKARIFEVTGAGGFLLTQRASGLDKLFVIDSEIAVFDTAAQCADSIRYFLAHPAGRDALAQAGNAKSMTQYSYKVRLASVLSALPPHVSRVTHTNKAFDQIVARHKTTTIMKIFRAFMLNIGRLVYGSARGPRFARRFCFEVSWRLARKETYRASGCVGIMFYDY